MSKIDPIVLSVTLHPTDYKALQMTAARVGLNPEAFCQLAIHRCTTHLSVDRWGVLSPIEMRLLPFCWRGVKQRENR